jgi:hypothetical protein
MYCGEPVEARCSSRCADYERRISIDEALLRIHDLEAKLAESEKYRAGYADMLIPLKVENAKLREQLESLQPTDCEGNILDIADTVHMLRSEWDGDHEWDDVIVELALTKWGGDRWIVRGSKGEAWACDCLRTGYDEDAYEGSDDAEPIVNPTLIEAENAKLRDLVLDAWTSCPVSADDCLACKHCLNADDDEAEQIECELYVRMRELGIEVGKDAE